MKTEEKYNDVLQNLEFFVVQFYQRNPELTDYAVQRVYEALIDFYKATS